MKKHIVFVLIYLALFNMVVAQRMVELSIAPLLYADSPDYKFLISVEYSESGYELRKRACGQMKCLIRTDDFLRNFLVEELSLKPDDYNLREVPRFEFSYKIDTNTYLIVYHTRDLFRIWFYFKSSDDVEYSAQG